ncbi:flagellar basal-body rod protein FlgF [Rhodovulum bhavnagarense]|uniref:Flagellar basal-body rod protein FlgF n=2 Tax=Rhodovulum bhavnagarense TaxID=992286 RepID=A0A4R2RFR2_9RHOB|nr:flagellar basal-body rod protein FlgF [Rhodovulum bhavnagarense]
MIFTALNAIGGMRDNQVSQAQNLANQSVPGYRRDLPDEGATVFAELVGSFSTRAFQQERTSRGFSQEPGPLTATGDAMDIAIADEGYFFILPDNGEPALSRRGDLRLDAEGVLRNGAGDAMLDMDGQQITLPPHRDIVVNELGEIWVQPMNGQEDERILAATLGTVIPGPDVRLQKSLDGNIRVPGDDLPPPDQGARISQGVLEGSNVNAVEELIDSIEMQRRFELNFKLVSAAREIDEGGARLLQVPQG